MSSQTDLELLRRFEPVIRYTRGEQFFPTDVDSYVQSCSLWVQRPREEAICLVPEGELTPENLAQPRPEVFGAVHFLKLTEPLSVAKLATRRMRQRLSGREPREVFRAGVGRLVRVGYLSRFIDALFSISLLARGRVPGDRATSAALAYRDIMAEQERYRYCGRVLHRDGWIVLQYWFLYFYNDWRSSFFGANDHESDWEMICVYVSKSATGEMSPEWVAYASHDYSGDDLRRRWDDPELEKVGDHPVVYAGAGSHASYYTAGEYLTEAELPFLAPLIRVTDSANRFWTKTLRQYSGEEAEDEDDEPFNVFRVPFVDYARGDGLTIGPGQGREWSSPLLLNPTPGWVAEYRGLWGLYARDPFGGEDAPAGPMYNRDGTVRQSWYDPLGWAGLDKEAPLGEALETALRRQVEVKARQSALQSMVEEKARELKGLNVEASAMRGQPHMSKTYKDYGERIGALSEELRQLRGQLTRHQALGESLERHADGLRVGERAPARAHIRRAHQPASDTELRHGRIAELWAAVSMGAMLLGFVGVVLFARQHLVTGLVAVVALFVFVESTFRGRLTRLVTSVTIGLAAVAALVILYDFFWPTVIAGVLIAGGYILWENLRELWT